MKMDMNFSEPILSKVNNKFKKKLSHISCYFLQAHPLNND
jgi:hypothetical protein